MEILTYELARKLAIEHSVIVYSKREKGQTIIEQDQGVTYKRIDSTRDRGYIWFSTMLNSTFPNYSRSRAKKPFFALKGYYHNWALKVVEDVCSENCDIIHIHNLSQFVPLFRKALPSVKIVLHMHAEWLTQLDRELIENRINEADLILSCSEFITEKTRTLFPIHSENCKTLHNGVDVHKFTMQEDKNGRSEEKKVLFVGRNSPEKGVHLLIKAFESAVSQYPQLNLQIIGPQGPAPIMQERA
jgi:glycosyltransferase involved in cell wall biosynthesis